MSRQTISPPRLNSQLATQLPNDGGVNPWWINALRPFCLFASNTILQFPMIFEMQQRALDQPDLLRREVLQDIPDSASEFTVLDYGCGSGTYAGLFDSKNYLGIDCSASMIARASAQHPNHRFICADNLDLIRESIGPVSHIFLVGVIHHLSEAALISILKALPKKREIRLLSIDTLKCDGGPGQLVQLFERGEYLRNENDHRRLLARISNQTSFKLVPYGKYFDLAVYRGVLKPEII